MKVYPGRVAAFASSRLKLYLHDNSVQCVSTQGVIQVDIRHGACILLLHGDSFLVARCFDAYFVPHNREDYSNYHRSRSRVRRLLMRSRKLCPEVIQSVWITLIRLFKRKNTRMLILFSSFVSYCYRRANFIRFSEVINNIKPEIFKVWVARIDFWRIEKKFFKY